MINFGEVKLVVFDLDGTLYEDTHHFFYYANRIKGKLPFELQPIFEKEYDSALINQHPLIIGRVYDTEQDLILVQRNGIVKEAYRWEGTPLAQAEVEKLYPIAIEVNLDDMISIGDLWWLPSSIGRHYGLTGDQSYQAFLETREYMMGPDFQMNRIPDLMETLQKLRNDRRLILVTNSPEPDSSAILHKLGLLEIFHERIFLAQKPTKTKEVFLRLINDYKVRPEEVLSVGDNGINEILPAQTLGCQTIYIDPHRIAEPKDADWIVQSMSEVVQFFKQNLNEGVEQ
jgi:HAD superfamily hydrolase (TIGR01549 family)